MRPKQYGSGKLTVHERTSRKPYLMPRKAEVQAAELRRNNVMRLRVAGKSYGQIAVEQGVSKTQVIRDITKYLADDTPTEEGEQVRVLQMERYERVLEALWPLIIREDEDGKPRKPDLDALREWRLTMARIDRIHGIEARTLAEINVENLDARTQVLIADGGDARELLADRVAAFLERVGPPESPNGPAELTAGNGAAGPV